MYFHEKLMFERLAQWRRKFNYTSPSECKAFIDGFTQGIREELWIMLKPERDAMHERIQHEMREKINSKINSYLGFGKPPYVSKGATK
jgi:hypothetical protein